MRQRPTDTVVGAADVHADGARVVGHHPWRWSSGGAASRARVHFARRDGDGWPVHAQRAAALAPPSKFFFFFFCLARQ